MFKRLLLITLMTPAFLLAQGEKRADSAEAYPDNTAAKIIGIKHIYFNKKINLNGKGEDLEVEVVLQNLQDDPLEFYMFVIATYEKKPDKPSSFGLSLTEKKRIWHLVPYPDVVKNYEYPDTWPDGRVKKDKDGKELLILKKLPKDPKAGINPDTGKMYKISKDLTVRSRHLSKYRNNYFFFNEVTIYLYDKEGNPITRQLYALNGFRR